MVRKSVRYKETNTEPAPSQTKSKEKKKTELTKLKDTGELRPNDEEPIGTLRQEVHQNLGAFSANVTETVDSLSHCSKSLDEMHSKSRQLADYSSTIASAGEELSTTIHSINKNVQNTINASTEAKKLATKGMEVVDSTRVKIEDLSNMFKDSNDALENLLSAAEDADKIIRVVNDISSKTDLLSLNASIEAARAGEAGKGFAVVAHEVSRLSERTQTSISDIENIIENIKKEISRVSEKVSEGNESAIRVVKGVNDANSNIKNIVNKIQYVDNEVSNIGAAIKEQGQAVTDIAQNVSTISEGSRSVNLEIERISNTLDNVTNKSNSTRNKLSNTPLSMKDMVSNAETDYIFLQHKLRRLIDGKEIIQPEYFDDYKLSRLEKYKASEEDGKQVKIDETKFSEIKHMHTSIYDLAMNCLTKYKNDDKKNSIRFYKDCTSLIRDILTKLELIKKDL